MDESAPREVRDARLTGRPMVGRASELDQVTAALRCPPALVVVEGEAGIGKTRLIGELPSHPLLTGRVFVVGGCRPIREPFPLGPVVEALQTAGGALNTAALSPVAGALRPLLPELADLLPPKPEPLDDRTAERHRLFRGLREVLAALGPAVLVLEDMHWADEQTVDFLAYLLDTPPPELGVVLTYREDEVHLAVRTATARPAPAITRSQVTLRPLDAERTGVLAASLLGVDEVSEEFATYLCERSSGVPYAIQELLALLQERGTLVRRGHGWARRAIDELDVPSGVRASVLERLGRLSDGARHVVEAAAVLQLPTPIDVLADVVAATPAERPDVLRALDEALESGLVVARTDGGQTHEVGFRHVLAVQAVYEAVPLSRRRDLHARAAVALRSCRPVPLGQLAHHLRHAGQVRAWVEAAEQAADRALALNDDAEALRLLHDVLRHVPPGAQGIDDEWRARLAIKLGWATTEALRAPEAIDTLSAVLDHDLPPSQRGELRFLLALLYERRAVESERQRERYEKALEDLGDRPELAAWAMIGISVPTRNGPPFAEYGAVWLGRALDQLERIDDPILQVSVRAKVAMILTTSGDPRWAQLTEEVLARTGGRPRHRREVNSYYSIGFEACYAGRYPIAERLLTAAASGSTDHRQESISRAGLLLLDYCRGSWDGLDADVTALLEALENITNYRLLVETVAACVAVTRGEPDAASRLDDVLRRVWDTDGLDLLALPVTLWLRLAVAGGDPTPVLTATRPFLETWDTQRLWPAAVRVLPALTDALVVAGAEAEAQERVARTETALAGLDAPLAPAALSAAHGFLTSRTDPVRAAELLGTAADAFDGLSCRYEAAQARERAADLLASADDARGRTLLTLAMRTYDAMGARWDLERASHLARRIGVSVPARHRNGPRGYGGALSPREAEVARLASTGMTNKQIATALFISAKTVDKHLSAALRKLGVRSRVALAGRLGDLPAGAHGNGESSP
ncbi:MAG TPA: AAA family ATPase [Actinopolymorphaceae bacterium]